MYNLWLIFSIPTIAGMGIYVGWHFAKAIASGLSIGIDWLAIKLEGARDRLRGRTESDEKEKD